MLQNGSEQNKVPVGDYLLNIVEHLAVKRTDTSLSIRE